MDLPLGAQEPSTRRDLRNISQAFKARMTWAALKGDGRSSSTPSLSASGASGFSPVRHQCSRMAPHYPIIVITTVRL